MKRKVIDRKSWWTYAILNLINWIAVKLHFAKLEIEGAENLPQGAFILISNHTTRWDGSVMNEVLGRQANYMVSPNELKGLQGLLLRAVGAFPADPKFDLLTFMRKQALRGEPIVIFPEGNIFRDGSTHQFKPGAARIALLCANAGLNVPVVPMAVIYSKTKPEVVRILIGERIDTSDAIATYSTSAPQAVRNLSVQMHREVCHLRSALGSRLDREVVHGTKPMRQWVPRPFDESSEDERSNSVCAAVHEEERLSA